MRPRNGGLMTSCIVVAGLTLVGMSCRKEEPQGRNPESTTKGTESERVSDVHTVIILRPTDEDGGDRTRVLIRSRDGRISVDPTDCGAGFTYDMRLSIQNGVSGGMVPTYWMRGAVQVFEGKVPVLGDECVVESDPLYPMTFKLYPKGLVYLCGRGTISSNGVVTHRLGTTDTVDQWLPRLESNDDLVREAAAQALGFLSENEGKQRLVIPKLIQALSDNAMAVRRNAAEALGRLRATDAQSQLTKMTDEEEEKDDWVRKCALDALRAIGNGREPEAPNKEPEVTP